MNNLTHNWLKSKQSCLKNKLCTINTNNYLSDVIKNKIYFDKIYFLKNHYNYKLFEKTNIYNISDINKCEIFYQNKNNNCTNNLELNTIKKILNSSQFISDMFDEFLKSIILKININDHNLFSIYYDNNNDYDIFNNDNVNAEKIKLCLEYYFIFINNNENKKNTNIRLEKFNKYYNLSIVDTNDIDQILNFIGYDFIKIEENIKNCDIYFNNNNQNYTVIYIPLETNHYYSNKIFKYLIDIINHNDLMVKKFEVVNNIFEEKEFMLLDVSDKKRFYEFCYNFSTKYNQHNYCEYPVFIDLDKNNLLKNNKNKLIKSNAIKGINISGCEIILEKIYTYINEFFESNEKKLKYIWLNFIDKINEHNCLFLDKIINDKQCYEKFEKFILFKIYNIKTLQTKLLYTIEKLEEKKIKIKEENI
jgi:hypothetical protein